MAPPCLSITHHNERRAIYQDELTYPVPQKFDPDRYLKDGKLDLSVKDPEDTVFGSGRR